MQVLFRLEVTSTGNGNRENALGQHLLTIIYPQRVKKMAWEKSALWETVLKDTLDVFINFLSYLSNNPYSSGKSLVFISIEKEPN